MTEFADAAADALRCPTWCRLEHHEAPVFLHESDTERLSISRPREDDTEFLKVRTCEYLPSDIPDGSEPWGPVVELEHHVDDRYRLLNLTSADARGLALLLLAAAEKAEEATRSATGDPCR